MKKLLAVGLIVCGVSIASMANAMSWKSLLGAIENSDFSAKSNPRAECQKRAEAEYNSATKSIRERFKTEDTSAKDTNKEDKTKTKAARLIAQENRKTAERAVQARFKKAKENCKLIRTSPLPRPSKSVSPRPSPSPTANI